MHAGAAAETSVDMRNRTEATARDNGKTGVREAAEKQISDRGEGCTTPVNGQETEASVETARMGAVRQQVNLRRTTSQRDRLPESIAEVRNGSNGGAQRTQEVDASFYTARETT
jgi:hypothetical protein